MATEYLDILRMAATTPEPHALTQAIRAMNNAMSAVAFTASIDLTTMLDQSQSILFNRFPTEIRTRIFEYAASSSDDHNVPYEVDRIYYRPDFLYGQKSELALLQTCKRIFKEARLMPVSQAEHTFWLFGGPLRNLRTRKHAVADITGWQNSLNKEQQSAVEHVHLFAQQFYLEDLDARKERTHFNFQAKSFTLTFRHSDWWTWESPAESTDRLGICPFIPGRVSHQAMLSQPVSPSVKELRSSLNKDTWGWHIGQIKGLEILVIEFETDIVKQDQLNVVLEEAKGWKFLLSDSEAVLEYTGSVETLQWVGNAHRHHDNRPMLRPTGLRTTTPLSRDRTSIPMRTYYVAKMRFKKRSLLKDESG